MPVLDHSLWNIFQKKRKKPSKYCDPPQKKKEKINNLDYDVIIFCKISLKAGLPQGGFRWTLLVMCRITPSLIHPG